jgi:hypothetical protein
VIETATVPVMCSVEVLEKMTDWGLPVQVRAIKSNGEWSLELRTNDRLLRAVDRILATYRAHWRAGEDVILQSEVRELALAREDYVEKVAK